MSFSCLSLQHNFSVHMRFCLNGSDPPKPRSRMLSDLMWFISQTKSKFRTLATMDVHASTLGALTLNAPIATKVVCFSHLLKCLRSLYGKQCGPISDCSYRSNLFWVHAFASILNSSVMLGNYLQQTTSAEDIFRCIFSWRVKG